MAYVAYREGHIGPADARLWFTQLAAKTAERPSERPHVAYDVTGKAQRVSDGDTITIRTTSGESLKIRLHGIDTPESKQSYGSTATAALKRKVRGRSLIYKLFLTEYGESTDRILTVGGAAILGSK